MLPLTSPDGIPGEVADKFEELALQLRRQGWASYSADAILHRIRWHYRVDKNQRDFKCNNNWTAPLARWCMARNGTLRGFFETRERRHD